MILFLRGKSGDVWAAETLIGKVRSGFLLGLLASGHRLTLRDDRVANSQLLCCNLYAFCCCRISILSNCHPCTNSPAPLQKRIRPRL